jgi:diguanylate cyclase
MRKHPLATYWYVYSCNFIAFIIILFTVQKVELYSLETVICASFIAILVCIARMGSIEIIGLKILVGWQSTLEIAALFILPFPIFCMILILSFVTIIFKRKLENHPEPYLGPDFNTANVIISGLVSKYVLISLIQVLGSSTFGTTFAFLSASLIYYLINISLLSLLLSIDMKKPLKKVGSLDTDALVSEAMMVTAGALLARIFMLDPSLIILLLVPMIFLHRTLARINDTKLVNIDSKTGLYNYRMFDETLKRSFEEAKKEEIPLSIVFGDMDYLRDVNNTYGHLIGDKALVAVANVFKQTGDPTTFAARFGGEEFVLILPRYTKEDASSLAETIRSNIEQTEIHIDDEQKIQVTMSLGIATFPQDAQSMKDLVQLADESLYEAKHSGRNCVVAYGG